MNILLLAPHPFYQERGTPIAVDLLVRVLAERGDKIDILTYHEGADLHYPGNVTIRRIPKPPFASGIKPGFSFKKLICDRFMLKEAMKMAKTGDYNIVHAVEESVFIALFIKRKYGIPYVFDMDSSMPRQIADRFPFLSFSMPLMNLFERRAVLEALAVVPVCDSLANLAKSYRAKNITVLRDVSLLSIGYEEQTEPAAAGRNFRKELGILGICFLYVGNLEKYQGIDLLLKSFSIFLEQNNEAGLLIAGGTPKDIAKYRKIAEKLRIERNTHFVGHVPLSRMDALFQNADILVSPRIKGANTPMKIFSYLDSGKPVLATNLPTHTQVLNDSIAMLESPEPTAFARGMKRLAQDAYIMRQLSHRAKELVREKYTFDVFKRTANNFYDWLETQVAGKK